MARPDRPHDRNPDDGDDDHDAGTASRPVPADKALYVGDQGELPLEARRAYVHLLLGPCIEESRHGQLWAALVTHEDVLRRRLADCFLELVLDMDAKFAFTRQADAGDLDVPQMFRTKQLTLVDSLLLLYLRQRLSKAESEGVRAIVTQEELLQHMIVYERAGNMDHAGHGKRVDAAVKRARDYHVLHKVGENYEISPALKLMISAEDVRSLTDLYRALVNTEADVDLAATDAIELTSEED
jgi:hypothetical protein